MKIQLLVAAATLVAAVGSASAISDYGQVTMDRLTGLPITGGYQNRAIVDGFRNWTNPPSVLQAFLTTGIGRLDGDDMTLVPNGVNLMSDLGFSIANNNPTGTVGGFTSCNVAFNVFDAGTLVNLGAFNANLNFPALIGGVLTAQGSVRINFGDGALEGFGIFLPNNILVTQTITAMVVSDPATNGNLVAQQIRNPVATGSSLDQLVINGAVTASPFGGNPVGNESYLIRTNSVPTPASVALLGLGGLLAGRRRR